VGLSEKGVKEVLIIFFEHFIDEKRYLAIPLPILDLVALFDEIDQNVPHV
jgi:hypothetical protein